MVYHGINFTKEYPMYAPSSHQTNKPTEPTEEDWELFEQEIDDMEQAKLDHQKKIEQIEKDRILREEKRNRIS